MDKIIPSNATLASYSEQDKKWDKHRSNAQTIGGHYDAAERFAKLGSRIAQCSTNLGFGWNTNTETGEAKVKLKSAMFCKVRHCPVCQWRRSLRNTARFFAAIPQLQEKFPSHRWLFLTLTVRNCEPSELRETIAHMNKSWQRLIQRKDWPAHGWVRTVEVTRNPETGMAHPHFHAMLMVPASYFGKGYVKQEEWTERWQSTLRSDYLPIVHVTAVKSKKEGQTLQAAVVETLKYASKVEDSLNNSEWLYVITEQLHKMRFIASGGELKDIFKEDFTNDEMIAGEDSIQPSDKASMWFGWENVRRQYVRKETR